MQPADSPQPYMVRAAAVLSSVSQVYSNEPAGQACELKGSNVLFSL